MGKIFLVCAVTVFMFDILLSFIFFHENQNERRYAEAEMIQACSVLVMSIEENIANHSLIKTGDKEGLVYDAGTLFNEFSAFLKNCRYIKGEDVKMKILIFQGIITYYNLYNEEIYSEPVFTGDGITDMENKIKRQMIKAFPADGFSINDMLFEGLEDKTIILIYEKKHRNIGFTEKIDNTYYYSKLKIS